MTKNEFLKLNENIGQLPPDISIRIEYMENQFLKLGLSKETGYKAVQYFYNELCKAREQKDTIFEVKHVSVTDEYFAISNHFSCYFKMKHVNFENRKKIYFHIPKNKETPANPKQIPSLPEIFKSTDYFDFVIDKTTDYYNYNRDSGQYKWVKSKASLAGLAIQLRDKNRLCNPSKYTNFEIDNNQDLRRVFCEFFNIEVFEKAFQPDSIKPNHTKLFSFITDFSE